MIRLSLFIAVASVASGAEYRVATIEADVTPPIGHPLLASSMPPARSIEAKLWAKGIVLTGDKQPIVVVSVDWCEIRNDAYDQWRDGLAEAAGTTRERVLLSCVHQHDTPLTDLRAQEILEEHGIMSNIVDATFHNRVVADVGQAVRRAMASTQPITHLGMGQAKVEKIASNRRYIGPNGKPRYDRGSATKNVFARQAPEGVIDPFVKALSFWNGDKAIAVLYSYATHPMSFYRTGKVNPDFPGYARAELQKEVPDSTQIYFSGAAGNVTAGKYNKGDPPNRPVLMRRLLAGMVAAWKDTKRSPLTEMEFRSVPLVLKPRESDGYSREDQLRKLKTVNDRKYQSRAALGLSWLERMKVRKQPIDLPVIDFGKAAFLLLPGESYVEYQLYAQSLRPNNFLMVAGYGESGTGYIPLEMHWEENDSNLNGWCWVARGSEEPFKAAIRKVLSE
ncbi:MAG: hypothetical protein CMO80_20465 [Verrucomicrobiales bacterium]|nr:hypothetical protein [Verrucomicrobiales bacterium]